MPAYKNQKGKWNCKFYYTDWTGKRRQKKKEGFATKAEAKTFETDFLNRCNASVEITFKNLVKNYLEDCKVHLKPTTIAHKEHIINKKILPYFSDMPISNIDVAMVRKWQNTLISHEDHYAPTYLKSIHNQLSAIMNFAVKYYGLSRNPASDCGSMGKKKADSMNFWTKAEFDTFIKHVSDKPVSEVAFYLLFYSGMREGELLALTLNDFDLIQSPKTPKSKRIITMPVEIMNKVKDYSEKFYDLNPSDRLLLISKQTLIREMKRGCSISGVKKIRIHDLRHSHASLLIELGINTLLISERLGHENVETTVNLPKGHTPQSSHIRQRALPTKAVALLFIYLP